MSQHFFPVLSIKNSKQLVNKTAMHKLTFAHFNLVSFCIFVQKLKHLEVKEGRLGMKETKREH
jgi:hypothetical protein